MRKLFYIVLFCCFALSAKAQDSSLVTLSGPSKKPWYLSFALDLKYRSIAGRFHYSYQGEYNKTGDQWNPYGNQWVWKDTSSTDKNFLAGASFYCPKLDITISRSRNWKFGLSYNFGIITKADYNYYSFLAISGLGEYYYYFKKESPTGPFAYGSLAIGYYRGTNNISGQGKELFGQARLGVGYRIKKDWMFRAFVSTDQLVYTYQHESPIFKKGQDLNMNMRLIYLGFGVMKQFTLVPD